MRWVFAGMAVVALAALGLPAARWWSHPDLFGNHGDGFSATPAPVPRASLSAGVTYLPEDGEGQVITFRDAHAHFAANSAHARATFSICRARAGAGPIISAKEDLSGSCAAVRPLKAGSRLTYAPSPRGEYVIVTLHPTAPGKVHLDRVDLDYATGGGSFYQRGTDQVSMDVTVRARKTS